MVGSQFSESQRARRPIWVSWHMSLAPWRWMRAENCLKKGMTESSPTEIWFHSAAGESMETEEEPPNMASPMPPLAFSS